MTTITSTTAAVAQRYVDAVSANDFAAIGQLLARDVLWAPSRKHPVRLFVKRGGAELSVDCVDVQKVRGDRIMDVWVFSDFQKDGNAFATPTESLSMARSALFCSLRRQVITSWW